MNTRRRGSRGLTLIEMLVALTLTTLVVSATYAVMRSGTDAQRRGEALTDLLQTARVAMDRLSADLQSAVYVANEDAYTFVGTDSEEAGFPTDMLEFACVAANPRGAETRVSDLCRVRYFVDLEERTEEEGLLRQEFPQPMAEELDPEEEELATREMGRLVVGLDAMYYDSEEQDWMESWEDREGLPPAVRVTLVLQDPIDEREQRLFATTVHLRLAGLDIAEVTRPEEEEEGGGAPGAPGEGPGGGPETPEMPEIPLPGGIPGMEGGLP